MTRRLLLAAAAALLIAGCGDDGGGSSSADPELVELLQDQAGQTEAIATCIAEKLDGDAAVDREELEAIIRGEGTTDTDTAEAYGDAAIECAQEAAGDLLPDDVQDQLDDLLSS